MGDKPGNHDETRSSRRETRETNLEIITKQDPVEDSRTETKEKTGSSRRERKEDKPGNHDETGSNRRGERETNLKIMTKLIQ